MENPRGKINTRVLNDVSGFEFYMVDINALVKLKKLPKSERYIQAQKLIGLSSLSPLFKKSLNNFFKYIEFSFNQTGAFFYIYDPSHNFFTIRIMDKDGELRNPGHSGSSDLAWKYFQVSGDSMDQKLAFIFCNKNSIHEFDFDVKNIEIQNPTGL